MIPMAKFLSMGCSTAIVQLLAVPLPVWKSTSMIQIFYWGTLHLAPDIVI